MQTIEQQTAAAIRSIELGNNGHADIGASTVLADAVRAAGVPEFDDVDPDTGRTVVYPAHCIVGGNVYWLEPLNGGAPFLMSCPVLASGAIGWDDGAEVGPGECAGYAEIMSTLTPSR